MNKLGETNSDEWDKIKGWMGAAQGKKDHPLVQEAKRVQSVQKFDAGSGDVGLNDETMKFLQPQGAGLIAPGMSQPAPAVQPPPVQAPISQPQPQAPVQPPPQAPPQAAPIPNQDYSSQAANELGTSPQELAAFIQKANTPTTGDTIRGVGASLADAFGRAGGSNPNYLEQNNKVELARREAMTGIPGKQVEAGKEKFGLSQTLGAQDPNSPYSKIEQGANREVLKSLGATNSDINKIPASIIHDIVSGKIDLKKALAEIENTAEFRRESLANMRANQQDQIQQGAAKGLENRGIVERARDFFSPSTETQTLERQASGGGGRGPVVDHRAAMQWAQAYPKDPRAGVIIQRAKQGLSEQ